MRLLLDENLSPKHAAILRQNGYDGVVVADIGLSGTSDSQVREFAIQTGRTLLTLDADFADILRFPPANTPGVIRLKIHPPTEEAILTQILRTLNALSNIDLKGRLAVSQGKISRYAASLDVASPDISPRADDGRSTVA